MKKKNRTYYERVKRTNWIYAACIKVLINREKRSRRFRSIIIFHLVRISHGILNVKNVLYQYIWHVIDNILSRNNSQVRALLLLLLLKRRRWCPEGMKMRRKIHNNYRTYSDKICTIDICTRRQQQHMQWENVFLPIEYWESTVSEWVRERKKENKTTSRIKSQWNLHFHLTCKLSIVYGRLYFLLNAILPFFSLTVDIDMPLAQLKTTSQCALNGSRALSHSLDLRWIILHAELIFNWIWLRTHSLKMYECTLKGYYHQQPTELWHRRRSGPP